MKKLKQLRSFIFIPLMVALLAPTLTGCGKNAEEAIEDAILTANQALSKGDCQTAIDLLEGVGRQNGNKNYLITLASAYGCRGNYNELTLFTTDIGQTGTPSTLGGFTQYSSASDMTSAADTDFTDVNTALNILLFAGGLASTSNPTSDARKAVFGASASGDIDAMIMYMTMVQLGRFLRYFGNPNATGVKQSCILNYNGALTAGVTLNDFLSDIGNSALCDNADDGGNTEIGTPGSYNETRLCYGVFLYNNFRDVLPNVLDNYTGGELSAVTDIRTDLTTQATVFRVGVGPTNADPILAATNLDNCIALAQADDTYFQWYYAYMLETLYD